MNSQIQGRIFSNLRTALSHRKRALAQHMLAGRSPIAAPLRRLMQAKIVGNRTQDGGALTEQERSIESYFQPRYYLDHDGVPALSEKQALTHYSRVGWHDGMKPNDWFDVEFYLLKNPSVQASGIEPLFHFISYGILEGRKPNAENRFPSQLRAFDADLAAILRAKFDETHYLRQRNAPDACDDVDLVAHYIAFGDRMDLSPSPDFDPKSYARRFLFGNKPDITTFGHYLRFGKGAGYVPSPPQIVLKDIDPSELRNLYKEEFDSEFYKEAYADLDSWHGDVLSHFIAIGEREGRLPRRDFDTKFYKKKYFDNDKSKQRPFEHYIRYGRMVGNATNADQPTSRTGVSYRKTRSYEHFFAADVATSANLPDHPNPACLKIHIVIPDPGKGGGGHMTIFRMVRWLEMFGHVVKVWVLEPSRHTTPDEVRNDVIQDYQCLRAEFDFVSDETIHESGDAIIATAWQTAALVRRMNNFHGKFYFVQDYEPSFFARGSSSILAETTYSWGLSCICASPWLEQIMRDHGNWARHFWLACDTEIYKPIADREVGDQLQIAVYARQFTARRAVELCLMALQTLHHEGVDFHAHLFGMDDPFDDLPFETTSHGVVPEAQLADLYNACDVGICFSSTNYSLVPKEMMACGLPVIELDGENTRSIYPEGAVHMVGPEPEKIVSGIRRFLLDGDLRAKVSEQGRAWATQFTWESSARMVEQALVERLCGEESARQKVEAPWVRRQKTKKASVIVPTFNGGELLDSVAKSIAQQETPWEFDVIIYDSSSTDGSISRLKESFSDFRYFEIPQTEFSHGPTRNRAIAESGADFVCFLTQDAIPDSRYWLYNLVTTTELDDRVAGSFGRHTAHVDADPFTRRDLAGFFDSFDNGPAFVSRDLDKQLWNTRDEAYIRRLHFFSDNNSCLRRSVWEDIPFPDVDYGEDQAWAWEVIQKGYFKAYARHAQVRHSHDYSPEETFDRAVTEAKYFRNVFGYTVLGCREELAKILSQRNREDADWALKHDLPQAAIDLRMKINEQHLNGLFEGAMGVELA